VSSLTENNKSSTVNSGSNSFRKFSLNYKNPYTPNAELSSISYRSVPKKSLIEITPSTSEQKTISNQYLNESGYRNAESTLYTNGPSFVNSNYNRSLNRSKYGFGNTIYKSNSQLEPSLMRCNKDNSYRIIDLLDKLKNFTTFACKDYTVLYSDNKSSQSTLNTNYDNLLFSPTDNLLNKNYSEELDSIMFLNRASIDSVSRYYDITKKNNSNEIEGIYKSCLELRDDIRSTINEYDEEELELEDVYFNSTKQNIEQINTSSDKTMEIYTELFDKCKDCLKDIRHYLFETINCGPNNINMSLGSSKKCKSDKRVSVQSLCIENYSKTTQEMMIENCLPNEKDDVIKEKLEKLKLLKEKKEQILSSKNSKLDSVKKNLFDKINISEIDQSESILNENVLIKLPPSKIGEVNKPGNEPITIFKLSTGIDENSFQDDSQIILNFDTIKEKKKLIEMNCHENINIDKTIHDSVILSSVTINKFHKRSKSDSIKKQINPNNIQKYLFTNTEVSRKISLLQRQI